MFVIDAINPKAESEGIWFDFMGSKFKIASTSSSAYQKRLAKLYHPHRRKIEQGKLDPDIGNELIAKALAGSILTDWKDVSDIEGNDVAFSKEVAKTALMVNEDLREFVMESATDIDGFRQEFKEAVVKT